MKNLFLILGIGMLGAGCSSTLPKSTVAESKVGDSRQVVAGSPSPLNTIGEVLEATGFETLPGVDSAEAKETSVAEPPSDSGSRAIRTVGELLADPQFKAVVGALEGAKQ